MLVEEFGLLILLEVQVALFLCTVFWGKVPEQKEAKGLLKFMRDSTVYCKLYY